MSQENVEIVRAQIDAYNRGDFEAVARTFHPDIEIVGGLAPVRGVAAAREWLEPDAFEDQRIEPLDFRVNGNKVLVRQRFTGRGAGSGMELDLTVFVVFTVEDDLVTRAEGFPPHEEAQALEAAGLSE
jgi:hypothetical protein